MVSKDRFASVARQRRAAWRVHPGQRRVVQRWKCCKPVSQHFIPPWQNSVLTWRAWPGSGAPPGACTLASGELCSGPGLAVRGLAMAAAAAAATAGFCSPAPGPCSQVQLIHFSCFNVRRRARMYALLACGAGSSCTLKSGGLAERKASSNAQGLVRPTFGAAAAYAACCARGGGGVLPGGAASACGPPGASGEAGSVRPAAAAPARVTSRRYLRAQTHVSDVMNPT